MMRLAVFRILLFTLIIANSNLLHAEGSVDFIDYPGKRLFFHAQKPQQLKAYAAEGEYLNFGASHVGVTGGFITIYRPDGSVHSVFDNTGDTEGLAIINNHLEERNGPTGGGTLNALGYEPGVIFVNPGEGGVWTFTLEFPTYNIANFFNLENDEAWNRDDHQPLIQRVITAWDITVSQNAAGNNGGTLLTGRVYSNEYVSMVNTAEVSTSPKFYVVTKDGIQYFVEFGEVFPWSFPINSNSWGLVGPNGQPIYSSAFEDDIIRTDDLTVLEEDKLYLYEPQAEDSENIINNKIFFNPPAEDLPNYALVTDIFRNNTHETWLRITPNLDLVDYDILEWAPVQQGVTFLPDDVVDVDLGMYIIFEVNRLMNAAIILDIDDNGEFDDPIDRAIYGRLGPGRDSLFWDAKDGLGNAMPTSDDPVTLDYQLVAGQGEIHIALTDIEDNPGGIKFTRLNGRDAPSNNIKYNHEPVGGEISGGTLPHLIEYTTEPYTYDDYWGNKKYLDYFSFEAIPFVEDSVDLIFTEAGHHLVDSDLDGIRDVDDIDDDNDGILDSLEYCNLLGAAACLPDGIMPWGDNDGDGIKNFVDADDPSIPLTCQLIEIGECDQSFSIFDSDGDGLPNHLDADLDNDGVFDVIEAGHGQSDNDGDGIVDGDISEFGANGFLNALESDDTRKALMNYSLLDWDSDLIPNLTDLDSDNDGIPCLVENLLTRSDVNIDGRLDEEGGRLLLEEDFRGIAPSIHPILLLSSPTIGDQDGDGIPNYLDLDSDNDGIHDVGEASFNDDDNDAIYGSGIPDVNEDGVPSTQESTLDAAGVNSPFYFARYDTDRDSIPDFLDLDSDNDGLHDVLEVNFSDSDNDGIIGTGRGTTTGTGITIADAILVPFFLISNPPDWDGDNIPDYKDLDTDNDGIHDAIEIGLEDLDNDGFAGTLLRVNASGQLEDAGSLITLSRVRDQDNDGVPDYKDRDSDNDGIHDVAEAGLADPDNDAVWGSGVPTTDYLGRALLATSSVTTSLPGDKDGDEVLNFRDLDSDNDGLLDVFEAGNEDPEGDGILSMVVDAFGIPSDVGTSTSIPTDSDDDGTPDYLSLDSDGDSIPDAIEANLSDPDFDGILGTGEALVDEDGVAADPSAAPPILAASVAPDSDNDGLEDFRDADSDNDNISDGLECPTFDCRDLDEDGLEDYRDPDRDNDGLLDSFECTNPTACADLDADGIPNIDDLDSDGDELADSVECPGGSPCPDVDQTSVADVYEFTCHDGIRPVLANISESETYCVGSDILLTAENQGVENAMISYIWTSPDGTETEDMISSEDALNFEILNAQEAAAGVYTLTSTAPNGCISVTANVTIDIVDEPTPAVISVASNEFCTGSTVQIDAAVPSINGLSYEWYFDDGSGALLLETTESPTLIFENATSSAEGSYSLVIRTANCQSDPSNEQYITIKPEIITTEASNSTSEADPACIGSALTLFAEGPVGATYEWSGPNGFTSTEQNPNIEDINTDYAGEYQYQITIPGCDQQVSNTTLVFVQEAGSQPLIVGNESGCIGGSYTMEIPTIYEPPVDSEVTYNWYASDGGSLLASTSEASLTIEDLDANTIRSYYAEVVVGQCTTSPSETFDFELDEAPSDVAFIPNDLIYLCGESEIDIDANVPTSATGTWLTSSTATIVTPDMSSSVVSDLPGGNFTLVWSLSSGSCENFSSDTLFVVVPDDLGATDDAYSVDLNGVLENVNVVDNDDIPNGFPFDISIIEFPTNGEANVDAEGALTYTPNDGFLEIDEFTYEICVEGCDLACEIAKVIIDVQPSDCSIPNIITPNGDGLNDTFIIPCSVEHPESELMILNRWGDKVFTARNYKNDWDGSYRGNELPPGTYYYLYSSEKANESKISGFITLVR